MHKLLLALLLLTTGPALSQSNFTMPPPAGVVVIGTQVVATCGTGTLAATQGFVTIDTTGVLCSSTGGGGSVTQGTSPWVVSGNGTAGTAAAGVLSVQGIASMTALQVAQATAASLNATVVGTGTLAVQPNGAFAIVGITPTDRTITSASGSSQQMAAALATRHSLTIQNTGNANCGVNPTGGTAAIGGAGTLTLAPLGTYSPRVPTLSAVTVICTAGQPIFGSEN